CTTENGACVKGDVVVIVVVVVVVASTVRYVKKNTFIIKLNKKHHVRNVNARKSMFVVEFQIMSFSLSGWFTTMSIELSYWYVMYFQNRAHRPHMSKRLMMSLKRHHAARTPPTTPQMVTTSGT